MTLAKVHSAAVLGIDAYAVEVEIDVRRSGFPNFQMVGLPDEAVRESRERVSAALKNAGFDFPPARITVNFAPADIRKEGSAFDLPVAPGQVAFGATFVLRGRHNNSSATASGYPGDGSRATVRTRATLGHGSPAGVVQPAGSKNAR